jgi:hypothetical protein
MIEWIEVGDSAAVTAIAYDAEEEAIFVRFDGGGEWRYESCPPHIWAEFTEPGISKGRYIASVLRHHPNARHFD